MLMRPTFKRPERPYSFVKMGRECGHGYVLGTKRRNWMINTYSQILNLQAGQIFDRIIDQTITYLAKTPNPRETLVFEDIGRQFTNQFGEQLTNSGYHIREMDLAGSSDIESWYSEALCIPTAIMVPPQYFSEFMRNLTIYTIDATEYNALPASMTVVLSRQTAINETLCIARAYHRNIYFVIKSDLSEECRHQMWNKDSLPLYADAVVKYSTDNGKTVALWQDDKGNRTCLEKLLLCTPDKHS